MKILKILLVQIYLCATYGYSQINTSIIITEIMSNPACISDNNGEWFEVYNQSDSAIDMNGWTLRDNGSNLHTINHYGPLIIMPDSFLTFGNNSDSITNGNYICDYQYSSFQLANSSDEIIIKNLLGETVDSVAYGSGASVASPSSGISSVYISCGKDDNNIGSNWQSSISRESTYFGNCSDQGSPGLSGAQQIVLPALKIISPSNICEGDSITFISNITSTTQKWYGDSSLTILLDSGNFYQVSGLVTGNFEIWLADTASCNPNPVKATVTVSNRSISNIQITECETYTWSANGQTYTSSGAYTATLTNASGCDSVVTLNLTINNSNTGSESITACDTYTWSANGQTYTSSGSYTATITNALGCDSVATLNLTINNSNTGSEMITACDTYTWSANGQSYTSSGTYTATLTNAAGCDSVVTLSLTINSSSSSSQTASACDTYTWTENGQTYTSSGTYTTTLTNALGCDSVITLNLIINSSNTGTETITACDTYTWSANGQTYTTGGGYTATLTNAAGCDSVVTLNLTINTSTTSSASDAICQGDTNVFGTQTLTAAGTYTETFIGSNGCDSTVTLTLTVNPTFTSSTSADICDGDTYVFGSQSLTNAGTYTEVFQASNGCDSTVTLTLNVTAVDTSVSVSNNTLTANNSNATYQWIDCDNGNTPIAGETNQSFTATQNGNYAVIVTENNCSDTSACFNVNVIALRAAIVAGIRLYPNPTKNKIFVDYSESIRVLKARIVTMTGLELMEIDPMELRGGINTMSLKAGMYHLVLEGDDFRKELRFVKD